MSRCAMPGCIIIIPRHRLMCQGHWNLVPRPLQKTVVMLWNNGKVREGYEEASANAVTQAQVQLRRRQNGELKGDTDADA